jgi:tetratricopeptide (TPR) repeat protein
MMTLPHRALCFACLGRYEEAIATFREGREYGEHYGNRALVARVISMCGGTYVPLFDYEKAEALAEEARAFARAASFPPPLVSSSLDLAVIATRRGDLALARTMLEEVTKPAEAAGAWHGWVWRMRLDELRAELALRAGEHEIAIEAATRGLERATKSSRPKYCVWSRCVRAAALAALGKQCADDFDAALADARSMNEPALLLHAMRASLAVRPDEALAVEARALLQSIAAAHPDETTRARLLERAAL